MVIGYIISDQLSKSTDVGSLVINHLLGAYVKSKSIGKEQTGYFVHFVPTYMYIVNHQVKPECRVPPMYVCKYACILLPPSNLNTVCSIFFIFTHWESWIFVSFPLTKIKKINYFDDRRDFFSLLLSTSLTRIQHYHWLLYLTCFKITYLPPTYLPYLDLASA